MKYVMTFLLLISVMVPITSCGVKGDLYMPASGQGIGRVSKTIGF